MKTPKIFYDENDYTLIVKGDLINGGIINNQNSILSLNFVCLPYKKTKTDLEVTLSFDNGKRVELFLTKECDTIEEVQQYFTVLYTVYWILMILIALLIVVIFLYYLQRNNMSLNDLYEQAKEYVNITSDYIMTKYYEYRYPEQKLFTPVGKYTEPELLDYHITSNHYKKNDEKVDYGGL